MNQVKKIITKNLGVMKAGGVSLASIILFSACTDSNMSDIKAFVSDTKEKYVGQVEPLPVIEPYETHRYAVTQIRDPFKPSVSLIKNTVKKRKNNGIKPSAVRNKEELERYPLSSLIMVGIMNNNGQNWAIIKAPDSSIYRVRKGNYLGEDNGKILNISESKIDLKEIVQDGLGGWIERKNKVTLSE